MFAALIYIYSNKGKITFLKTCRKLAMKEKVVIIMLFTLGKIV